MCNIYIYIYIYIYVYIHIVNHSITFCSSDMYGHTRARNECVCVTLTSQRCLLATCSLSSLNIRTFVQSKASACSTPKRSHLFQALEKSSKPSNLNVSFMNLFAGHLHWIKTSRIFQDLPGQRRSFAAKLPSNFSNGWFKEFVRINVCSTRSSSSSLAFGQAVVRSTVIASDSATCLLQRHRASLRGFVLQRFLQRHVESQPQKIGSARTIATAVQAAQLEFLQ